MEEVWKLQDELKKVQQASAKQKLSERNVVELVTKLVELRLVDILYTSDGKTYLTHQQLAKEIRDELVVHGGRINLTDLQQVLNVDFSHIESKASEMVKQDRRLELVLGQLIDATYKERLVEEINDLLHEQGHITIVELTRNHNLPTDFLRQLVKSNLGKKIKGQVDKHDTDIVFTSAFVKRMKAQIRGALSAVTVPTTIGPVRQSVNCQEHLFYSVLDELIASGRLVGTLSGSRQDKSQFFPDIYTRAQTEWVQSFYQQNGYLDYDSLSRQGISDPVNYIKKKFKSENLVYLSSCCVGPLISEQVVYSVDEALSQGSWVDVMSVLPSTVSEEDAHELLQICLKTKTDAVVSGQTIVASDRMVVESLPLFDSLMTDQAVKAVKNQPMFPTEGGSGDPSLGKSRPEQDAGRDDKKEQRRKKAATAGASKKEGTGGREVKMKSSKKKGRGRDVEEDSDDDQVSHRPGRPVELQFLTLDQIKQVLSKDERLSECPDELISDIAANIFRPLQKKYQEVAKSIFLTSNSGADRKKSAGEVQDKVNGLWTNMKLFEKGTKLFEESTQSGLVKHLLKTVGSDLTNIIVVALASDTVANLDKSEQQLTPEARQKLISTLPRLTSEPLKKLHNSVNGQSLDEFYSHVELLCGPAHLGLLLKKPDKKKERQLVFNHRQSLMEQLQNETESAMALHLASILLFQTMSQCMLHVPGRMVPNVISHLKTQLDEDKFQTLLKMQELVVKQAKLKSVTDIDEETETQLKNLTDEMTALLPQVKDIALTTKKTTSISED